MIQLCGCDHKYQDEVYGKHRRVFNPAKGKDGKGNKARCTVCGYVVEANSSNAIGANEEGK